MGKYVKTTKGIYELTTNRHLTDYPFIDNGRTMGNKQKLFENKSYIYYGDVVAQSDNLNELIDVACCVNKNNKNNRHFYHPKIVDSQLYQEEYCHEMFKVIGMMWCGDDLVKVAEWDNEKMEWELYER